MPITAQTNMKKNRIYARAIMFQRCICCFSDSSMLCFRSGRLRITAVVVLAYENLKDTYTPPTTHESLRLCFPWSP